MDGFPRIAPPKRPEFRELDDRIATFKGNWHTNHSKNAEEIAEAGFRYTGPGDNVHCFCCGGGLCKWQPEDDPWVEHAYWWPKCGFVLKRKGQEFVSVVQRLKSVSREISLDRVQREMTVIINQRNQHVLNRRPFVSKL